MIKIITWQHEDGPSKGKYYCTVGWQPFPIAEALYTSGSYDHNGDAVDDAEAWCRENGIKFTTLEEVE